MDGGKPATGGKSQKNVISAEIRVAYVSNLLEAQAHAMSQYAQEGYNFSPPMKATIPIRPERLRFPLYRYLQHLLQEAAVRLRQLLVVVRLERKPSLFWCARLTEAVLRLLIVNICGPVPGTLRGRIDKQLSLAGLVQAEEPESRRINRLSDLRRSD